MRSTVQLETFVYCSSLYRQYYRLFGIVNLKGGDFCHTAVRYFLKASLLQLNALKFGSDVKTPDSRIASRFCAAQHKFDHGNQRFPISIAAGNRFLRKTRNTCKCQALLHCVLMKLYILRYGAAIGMIPLLIF